MTATYIAELPSELLGAVQQQAGFRLHGEILPSAGGLPEPTGLSREERERTAEQLVDLAHDLGKQEK